MALNSFGLGIVLTAQDLASKVIKDFARDFKHLDNTISIGGKKISGSLLNLGAGLASISAGLVTLGALNAAARRFEDLEATMTEAAITAGLTKKQMLELQGVAGTLAVEFGRPIEEIGNNLRTVMALGIKDTAQASKFLSDALRFATATGSDLDVALKSLTGATIGYGHSTTEAAKASDILTFAAAESLASVTDFANALPGVIPQAANLNIGLDQVAAGLAAMTQATIPAAEASTALQAVFTAVAKNTKQAQEAAERLGIDFSIAALRSKGLAGFLGDVQKKTGGAQDAIVDLFGRVEAMSAVLTLGGTQAKTYAEIQAGLATATGRVGKDFKRASETSKFLTGQLEAARGVAVNLIGEAFLPIRDALKRVQLAFFEFILSIPKPLMRFGVQLIALAAAVITVGGAFLTWKAVAPFILRMLVFAKAGLLALKVAALPFLIAAAKIIAIVALLYVAFKVNLFGIRSLIEGTGKVFQILFELFRTGGFLTGALADDFLALPKPIMSIVTAIFAAGERFRAFFRGLMEGLAPIGSLFMPIVDATIRLGTEIFRLVGTVFKLVATALGLDKIFEPFFATGTDGFRKFGQVIGLVVGFIVNGIVLAVQLAIDALTIMFKLLTAVVKLLSGDFKGALSEVKGIGSVLKATAQGTFLAPGRAAGGLATPTPIGSIGGGNNPALAMAGAPGATERVVERVLERTEDRPLQVSVTLDGEKVGRGVRRATRRAEIRRGSPTAASEEFFGAGKSGPIF